MNNLEKAKQLADEAYKDIFGLQASAHQDAQVYATIALAEAVERLTVVLARIEAVKVINNATH